MFLDISAAGWSLVVVSGVFIVFVGLLITTLVSGVGEYLHQLTYQIPLFRLRIGRVVLWTIVGLAVFSTILLFPFTFWYLTLLHLHM